MARSLAPSRQAYRRDRHCCRAAPFLCGVALLFHLAFWRSVARARHGRARGASRLRRGPRLAQAADPRPFPGRAREEKERPARQFLTAASDNPLDRLIDAYITPEGLAALIADPAPLKNASSLSSLPSLDGSRKEIDWSKARHAFFTSPRDFAIDHEGLKLRFRFNGLGWKLHALDLQLEPTLKR